MARVARHLVIVEDTLYIDEAVEEAERLRDPTHVRNYTEPEWRASSSAPDWPSRRSSCAKTHPSRLARARRLRRARGERVRELLADRIVDGRLDAADASR